MARVARLLAFVVVAAGCAAPAALASRTSALCQPGQGYVGHSSANSPSYNYNTTLQGARVHIANSPRLPRVLMPTVSLRGAQVFIRYDSFSAFGPAQWRVELRYAAGCVGGRWTDETAGGLQWAITTAGERLYPRRCPGCVVTAQRIGGLTVTRRGWKEYGKVAYYDYVFRIGALTYNVRGHKPFTEQPADAQDAWLASVIRRATFVGR